MKGMIAGPDKRFWKWYKKSGNDKKNAIDIISPGVASAAREGIKPAHDNDRDIYLGKKSKH